MANNANTQDIKASVLHRCGELTDGTSDYNDKSLEYINNIYQSILSGGNEFDTELSEAWSWAKSANPAVLILKSPYSDSMTVTNGSSLGVLSLAPTFSLNGWYANVSGQSEFYRVTAHVLNTTAVTLDTGYLATSASPEFTFYKLDYDLAPSILRLIAPFKVYRTQTTEGDDEGKIYGLDLSVLERQYPLHRLEKRVPTYFAEKSRTAAGLITIRVNTVVYEDTKVEYDYIPYQSALTDSTASIPIIPQEFRSVLDFGATFYLLTDKNDNRAGSYFKLAQAKMRALVNACRKGKLQTSNNLGRIIPRLDLTWPRKSRYTQEVEE